MERISHESVWVLSDDMLNRCELTHRLEKHALLAQLCEYRTELALHFVKITNAIPTTILSFVQAGEQLIVDGSDRESLKKIEPGATARLHGSHNGVQLIIEAVFQGQADQDALSTVSLKGPLRIIRLQRREFFRIAIPVLTGPLLRVSQLFNGLSGVNAVRALDISRGGLALEIPQEIEVNIDDIWRNCTLTLPASGEVEFSLQVRSISPFSLVDGRKRLRIGCQYQDLHEIHGQLIEQYVLRMQRDHVARERGWIREEPTTNLVTIKKSCGR